MSRRFQVTFDAHDPRALSLFWRDVLGYVHPAPPGVELPDGADPLAAWDDFLEQLGVPQDQRNTRSAIEDPDGEGPRLFFEQVPEEKRDELRTINYALTCGFSICPGDRHTRSDASHIASIS